MLIGVLVGRVIGDGTCYVVSERARFCKELPSEDQQRNCLAIQPLEFALGWYEVDEVPITIHWDIGQVLADAGTQTVTSLFVLGDNGSNFQPGMLLDQSRNSELLEHCPAYKDHLTCCPGLVREVSQWPVPDIKIDDYYQRSQFWIYPRCAKLLDTLPCGMCHRNMAQMMYQIGPNPTYHDLPRLALRICRDDALEIYSECRSAKFVGKGRSASWVVPHVSGGRMGQVDFLKMVGLENVGDDLSVAEESNIPGVSCFSPRQWLAGNFTGE